MGKHKSFHAGIIGWINLVSRVLHSIANKTITFHYSIEKSKLAMS
jgi:hypothetical protein